MARQCSRTGCSRPADATMTYGYGARIAWLDDLDPEHAPSGYDLCREHADTFSVPQGWERADRRGAPTLFSRAG